MTKVDFILTVPAIWSDSAKKKTEDAAIRAGMGNENGLELLSEPESAAIYTLKNIDTTHSQIKVGDRIVVCDAGGGTVDLISYDIRRTHPSLSVMECAAGTGADNESPTYKPWANQRTKATFAAQRSLIGSSKSSLESAWGNTIANSPSSTASKS
jgi:hypothetical protein